MFSFLRICNRAQSLPTGCCDVQNWERIFWKYCIQLVYPAFIVLTYCNLLHTTTFILVTFCFTSQAITKSQIVGFKKLLVNERIAHGPITIHARANDHIHSTLPGRALRPHPNPSQPILPAAYSWTCNVAELQVAAYAPAQVRA